MKKNVSTKFIILLPVFILGIVSVLSNIVAVINIKRVNNTATQIANGYMECISELGDIQKETLDANEVLDHVRLNLFPEDVFVFTPKNRIMSLPRGATVVDFAYAIHSDVGDRAVGCLINNREAPLRTELSSRFAKSRTKGETTTTQS